MGKVKELYKKFMDRFIKVCNKYGRNPQDIKIVAVSKGVDIERIKEIISIGVRNIGENRVQEAEEKIGVLGKEGIVWHMVGHLQRNKVKKALKLFDMIQSVDSLKLAKEINKRAVDKVDVLIEVNTSGEEQKYGFSPVEIMNVFEELLNLNNLNILGLMTVGPYPTGEIVSRKAFALLREIKIKLEEEYSVNLPILSMGMTEDWEWAVAEGSTMLRLGRALFGERR